MYGWLNTSKSTETWDELSTTYNLNKSYVVFDHAPKTILYISFIHLLVNDFSVIRECSSTLYVGLAHAVPPINKKFKPLLLPTQAGMPYTNTHKHRTSYFKSTLTFLGPAKFWKSICAAHKNRKFLRFFIIIFNFKIFFSNISSDEIPPRSACKCLQNFYQSVAIHLK